jgi:hypothetical protein
MDEPREAVYMTLAENVERRQHRRRDFEMLNLVVERWDAVRKQGTPLGTIVDISPGGIRLKARHAGVTPDTHIRLRLKLPTYAGISPFIDHDNNHEPKSDWVGWMVVTRVTRRDDGFTDIAGRLVDMDEVDRGMFGLYLSTQPVAA